MLYEYLQHRKKNQASNLAKISAPLNLHVIAMFDMPQCFICYIFIARKASHRSHYV